MTDTKQPGSDYEVDVELELAPDGRIVDFLDSDVLLLPTPEEIVRQRFMRRLHADYGYAKSVMRREVKIMAGSSEVLDLDGKRTRADIVVYHDQQASAGQDQGRIKFIVECKRPDRTSGRKQLASYVFNTSALGGVWTNGEDVQAFRRQAEPANTLEACPDLPLQKEQWDAVDRITRDRLERPRDVKALLRLCHNKLHGLGVDGDDEDLAMDMVRILLAKWEDEVGDSQLPDFYCTQSEYNSDLGRTAVAARVQSLFRRFAKDNPGVFSDHEKITVSARAITEVVAVLQRWTILTRLEDADEWDIMGTAYEQYTATHLKRQRGQFFTNRLLVDFMVSAVEPKASDKVLDPAGGSGGFLTSALRYMRRIIVEGTADGPAREHQLANLRQRMFMGEISPRLVKIAKTAMLLNGDGHSGMVRGNSLEPFDQMDDWLKARCGRGVPDVILTNPPFAGQGDGKITDPNILIQYSVGRRFSLTSGKFEVLVDLMQDGCPPEALFFERCLDWLAPHGRLGIVMPKGFLDTRTYRNARELLFKQARLIGVVNCHKNTFQPHTGVRTCVLFVEKLHDDEEIAPDEEIFLAISQKIGQDSEGAPIFVRDVNGETTDRIDHDLDAIMADFRDFKLGELQPSAFRFSVRRCDLTPDLNINPQRYQPDLNASLKAVQGFDALDCWSVGAVGQLEPNIAIFKGPRLKTDNIGASEDAPPASVEPYYTPSAILQDRNDSIKWLDLSRASPKQIHDFEIVRVQEGDILITRSGSIGRIGLVTARLEGCIVSDDLIRVRTKDERLRSYLYAFLRSEMAQDQMRMNEYGSIQQHLEPSHIANMLVPVPDSWNEVDNVVEAAADYFRARQATESADARIGASWEVTVRGASS